MVATKAAVYSPTWFFARVYKEL